jgi:hypothetical protein
MDGKDLEAFVSTIERSLLPPGFSIENRRREYAPTGTQIAEFDLIIQGRIGSAHLSWLIECRDRPSDGPAPGSWIEQLVGRRARFRFDKVMAVSSTGFASGAVEYARSAGIDVRSLKNLSARDLSDWLAAQEIVIVNRRTQLDHMRVLISESEPAETFEAVSRALERYTPDEAVFVNPRTKVHVHPSDAFMTFASSRPELWPTPPQDGWSCEVKLRAIYPPGDRYVLVLDIGEVEVPEVLFDGSLRIELTSVPFTKFIEYVDDSTGVRMASSASGQMQLEDGTFTIALDSVEVDDTTKLAVRFSKVPE